MPDKDGILDQKDRDKIDRWLSTYPAGSGRMCPICSQPTWMLAERLVQPVTLGPDMAIQLGGVAGYPQIMLLSPCGYTRYMNAVMIGVLRGDEEKKA